MERRQLNYQFLTVLAIVMLGGGIAVIAARHLLPPGPHGPAEPGSPVSDEAARRLFAWAFVAGAALLLGWTFVSALIRRRRNS